MYHRFQPAGLINNERRIAMLTVCGWDLLLAVDKVICQSDSRFLGSATDSEGQRWLVLHNRAPDTKAWLCAAVSERMLEEVEAGRAAASDVFHHSLTGTVEIVRAGDGDDGEDERHDRCVRCADLPESLISGDGSIRPPARGRAARSARAASGSTTAAARTPSGGRRSCGAAKPRTKADGSARPGAPTG